MLLLILYLFCLTSKLVLHGDLDNRYE